jgi:hypothetical protein
MFWPSEKTNGITVNLVVVVIGRVCAGMRSLQSSNSFVGNAHRRTSDALKDEDDVGGEAIRR